MFTRVQIIPGLERGHLLQWTLSPDVKSGFTVDVFRMAADHSWSQVGGVADTYFFVDSTFKPVPRFDTVYKLVLNGTMEYVLHSFVGGLPDKDRNYIRAIRRREVLAQTKGGGRPGYLLKRRGSVPNDGAPPTACPSASDGGYYRSTNYGMLSVNSTLSTTKRTSAIGVFNMEKEVTRGLVYPILEDGDVWVERFTDRRYFITGKKELTYRGIPIVYTQIEMSLVPALSPIYDIPVGRQQQ